MRKSHVTSLVQHCAGPVRGGEDRGGLSTEIRSQKQQRVAQARLAARAQEMFRLQYALHHRKNALTLHTAPQSLRSCLATRGVGGGGRGRAVRETGRERNVELIGEKKQGKKARGRVLVYIRLIRFFFSHVMTDSSFTLKLVFFVFFSSSSFLFFPFLLCFLPPNKDC